jgi:hypothetical protein
LNDEGFKHFKVNHSVNFKDPITGAHTNTVEGMWKHAKASLSQYSRKKHFYGGYMAKFMFLEKCRLLNLDPVIEFFRLVGNLYNPHKYNNDGIDVSDDDILFRYFMLYQIEY